MYYVRPGYGFGGPCFPRDNRALGQHIKTCGIEPLIPMATDAANKAHTQLQAEDLLRTSKAGDKFVFTAIGYKENCSVPIIEESQKLYIAAVLAKVLPPALACLSVFILVKAYIQFQFQFVYSQPIRIEAEKGRTLN